MPSRFIIPDLSRARHTKKRVPLGTFRWFTSSANVIGLVFSVSRTAAANVFLFSLNAKLAFMKSYTEN